MRGDYLLEGGQGIVLLLFLLIATDLMVGGKGSAWDERRLMVTDWMVKGKGSARYKRVVYIRGCLRNSPAHSPPNGC